MSISNMDAAATVHGTLQDVHNMTAEQASTAQLPAYALYKLAREEELTAYRGLCRVLTMHYGADALQNTSDESVDRRIRVELRRQRRLLEDLQEELGIPAERSELELQCAADDEVVRGIHRSGVLRRRADFFDGTADVELPAQFADGRAEDDGRALYTPAGKAVRTEANVCAAGRVGNGSPDGASSARSGGGSSVTAASSKARAAAKKKVLAAITELGQEAERAAHALLHATDESKVRDAESRLKRTRESLLKLRDDPALEV